jgi:hypothetical protein
MPQMMVPNMLQQVMGPAPSVPAPAEEDTSSESESSATRTLKKKQAKQDERQLTSSAGILLKLPTKRLKQFVKAIAPELETLIAGDFTNAVLCRMLYCLSGIRPQTKTSNFGVKTFKDCIAKIVTRAMFHKKKIGSDAFDKIVCDLIEDCLNEDAGAVVEKSVASGFKSSWLEDALLRKRKRTEGNIPIQDGQQLTLQHTINKQQTLALGWVDPDAETQSTASSSWQQWGSNRWSQSDESNWTRGDWKKSYSDAHLWGEEHARSEGQSEREQELSDRETQVQEQFDRLAEEGELEQQLTYLIEKEQRDREQRERQAREQHECEQRQRVHLQREQEQQIQQERDRREQEQHEQQHRDREHEEGINIDQRNRINQSREAALQRRQLRQANSATEAVAINGTPTPEVATETITVDVASAPEAISDGGGTVHKCIICSEVLGNGLVLQTLKCMHVFHRSKNSTAMSNTK